MIGNRPSSDRAVQCAYGHTYFASDALVADGAGFRPLSPCPVCMDLSVASDIYKERTGVRPRWMSDDQLLRWFRDWA